MKGRIELGKRGEELAARFLKNNGYKILNRNYKIRSGEIDIVAREKDTICFIEVKTRCSSKFGYPADSITKHKQLQLSRLAVAYLKWHFLLDRPARFDIVSISWEDKQLKIELTRNAFPLEGYSY